MKFIWMSSILVILCFFFWYAFNTTIFADAPDVSHLKGIDSDTVDWTKKTDEYWKSVLSSAQYQVCRKGGTERPFTGELLENKEEGLYLCSSCGFPLFHSKAKFDSGTGWPSFFDIYKPNHLELKTDLSLGMIRTEVLCNRCKAHLGHVFNDGPKPTGLRYCINSVCLIFKSASSGSENVETNGSFRKD